MTIHPQPLKAWGFLVIGIKNNFMKYMQQLNIKITDKKIRTIKKIPYVVGKITIQDFIETFDIPIDWWSIEDYEYQWKHGLERLNDHAQSCLVTKIYNPHKGAFIDWWLLYKENHTVFIRNEILFRDSYDSTIGTNPFTPETCYTFIHPRTPNFLEDGSEVSEWIIEWKEKG